MSETQFDPEFNPFDSDNFEVSSLLNGVRGVIQREPAPEFKKWHYPGAKPDPQSGLVDEFTVLSFVVVSADLEKPREFNVRMGGAEPAVLTPNGLEKAIAGPFFTGKLNKGSNGSDFFGNLKAAGFDVALLTPAKGKGAEALGGADITWRALEKSFGRGKDRQTKAYDVPAQFHGFDGESPASAGVDVAALTKETQDAVLAALQQHKEISRGQLSIRVGPALKGNSQALALLLKDEFLASIPGTTYDKKTIKLS